MQTKRALYCNHKFEFTLISSRAPRAEVDIPAFVLLLCFDVGFDAVQESADLADMDRIWTGYGQPRPHTANDNSCGGGLGTRLDMDMADQT